MHLWDLDGWVDGFGVKRQSIHFLLECLLDMLAALSVFLGDWSATNLDPITLAFYLFLPLSILLVHTLHHLSVSNVAICEHALVKASEVYHSG